MSETATAKRLTELFGLLPKEEQGLVLNLVVHLLPDDVATEEDIADIEQALEEYARGEFYELEDLDMD